MSDSKVDATQTVLSNFGEKVEQLDQNMKRSNRMVLFAVLSAGALVGAQFVSTVVAQEWTKELKASGAQLTDLNGHMLSVEATYAPTVSKDVVLTPAYLRSLKEVTIKTKNSAYYNYQTVLGSEFRNCPVIGSVCCTGNDAYVIHTAAGVYSATQSKGGIQVTHCQDEAFLAGLTAPVAPAVTSRHLLLDDIHYSLDTSKGCQVTWDGGSSTCDIKDCDIEATAAEKKQCVTWVDAHFQEHTAIHDLFGAAGRKDISSANELIETYTESRNSATSMEDYCLGSMIGSFGVTQGGKTNPAWFGPKINLCTSNSLESTFWETVGMENLFDARLTHSASPSVMFWHSYNYAAFWGGQGLGDQCMFCMVCREFVPAGVPAFNNGDPMTFPSPESVAVGDAEFVGGSYTLESSLGDDAWYHDGSHECTAHYMKYVQHMDMSADIVPVDMHK